VSTAIVHTERFKNAEIASIAPIIADVLTQATPTFRRRRRASKINGATKYNASDDPMSARVRGPAVLAEARDVDLDAVYDRRSRPSAQSR